MNIEPTWNTLARIPFQLDRYLCGPFFIGVIERLGILPSFFCINSWMSKIKRPIRPETILVWKKQKQKLEAYCQKWLRSTPSGGWSTVAGLGRIQEASRSGSCTPLRDAGRNLASFSSSTVGNFSSNGARRTRPAEENLGPPVTVVLRRESSRWFSYNMRGIVVWTSKGLYRVVTPRQRSASAFCKIWERSHGYSSLNHKITRGRTSHIQTSKTAAATSYAVSPHLLRIKGSAFCFVNK